MAEQTPYVTPNTVVMPDGSVRRRPPLGTYPKHESPDGGVWTDSKFITWKAVHDAPRGALVYNYRRHIESGRKTYTNLSRRIDGPVPLSAVDWERVHRGELEPPLRVEVPEVGSADGDPPETWPALKVMDDGLSMFFDTRPGSDTAAIYTPDGHLIGYRTADGWQEVSAKANAGTPGAEDTGEASQPQCGGAAPESGGENPKADRQAGEKPAPICYHHRPESGCPVCGDETARQIRDNTYEITRLNECPPRITITSTPMDRFYESLQRRKRQYLETGDIHLRSEAVYQTPDSLMDSQADRERRWALSAKRGEQ